MSDDFDVCGNATNLSHSPVTELEQPEAAVVPAAPEAFIALGLAHELVRAVGDLGYTQPTTVQTQVIPKALRPAHAVDQRYADLMVSSQTGSGKTAAFLLPVLHTLIQQQAAIAEAERLAFEQACAEALAAGKPAPKRPKRKDPTSPRNFKAATPGALVLCPTRELAQQVAHDAIELVRHCRGLRIANVVGGMPYPVQIAKLQNADLVVATPGRLLDLQRSIQIKLDQVQVLVVDEADRMLDLGFSDDLAEINQLTAQRGQTMMFSATFAPRIQQLALRVMHDGGKHVQKVQIDTPQEKHVNIKQVLFWADHTEHKRALLDHWLRDASIDQAVVFCSTQVECDGLATDLQQAGFAAVALHGALSQGLRNRRLMALRNGQVQILVATDVAARGIDVPTITHVFNFGLPMKAEDYTHRIGRTGRAGRDGLAVTFAEFRDRRKIFDIEAFTHQRIAVETVPGLEPRQRPPQSEPAGRRRATDRRSAPAHSPRFEGRGDSPRANVRSEGRFGTRFEQPTDRPRNEGGVEKRHDQGADSLGDKRLAKRSHAYQNEARSGARTNAGSTSFGRPERNQGGDRFADRSSGQSRRLDSGVVAPSRTARRQPR